MKNIIILVSIAFFFSCSKVKISENNTVCLQSKINEMKPITVERWETSENIYYYFSSDCCDQNNYLYNSNCEIVCAPGGGFTGTGSGDCPNFPKIINKEIIYSKEK